MSDGTPAGPAGSGPDDDRVAAPGRRRAYGGDLGEPADREAADPVRIRCYRHEGIVVANHQRARGLRWLAATWELSSADGRTLAAPAELPDLRPGETAAVPVPLPLPQDGGEVWLTLRVLAAEDRPGLPRGTELCAPRVRLRAAAGPRRVSGSGLPSARELVTGTRPVCASADASADASDELSRWSRPLRADGACPVDGAPVTGTVTSLLGLPRRSVGAGARETEGTDRAPAAGTARPRVIPPRVRAGATPPYAYERS